MEEIESMRRLAVATNEETNKLSKLKFLSNGQDPQTKLRILRTCIFSIVTHIGNFKNVMDEAQQK